MSDPSQFDSSLTTHGFTGHEEIDPVGLVHMNGRVYDPEIGRFLSADPFVQDLSNSQSLNRYSYVLNNPTNYVDPFGMEGVKRYEPADSGEDLANIDICSPRMARRIHVVGNLLCRQPRRGRRRAIHKSA